MWNVQVKNWHQFVLTRRTAHAFKNGSHCFFSIKSAQITKRHWHFFCSISAGSAVEGHAQTLPTVSIAVVVHYTSCLCWHPSRLCMQAPFWLDFISFMMASNLYGLQCQCKGDVCSTGSTSNFRGPPTSTAKITFKVPVQDPKALTRSRGFSH